MTWNSIIHVHITYSTLWSPSQIAGSLDEEWHESTVIYYAWEMHLLQTEKTIQKSKMFIAENYLF